MNKKEIALRPKKRENTSLGCVRVMIALIALLALGVEDAHAAHVVVMISGGFSTAYEELVPQFEQKSGLHLITVHGPSMGTSETAIPVRLKRGDAADVVIVARSSLDQLANDGYVVRGSEKDLVRSRIGIAVRLGVPVPNISTVAALKYTLLNAKSIAYSDSASGVYVSGELFERLGIAKEVKSKSKKIEATPVGEIVAAGGAEVGFQQMSELLPVRGITVVGPIPAEVQKITVFSAGVTSNAKSREAAQALITALSAPSAAAIMRKNGLEPAIDQP